MFDIGWSELLLIGGVALVVIGPKDLPRALRTLGQTTAKVRRMAGDFQRQFNQALQEADMEDLRKGVSDVVDTARDLKNNFNPVDRLRSEIRDAIDTPAKTDAAASAVAPLPTVEVPAAGDYLNSLPAAVDIADPASTIAAAAGKTATGTGDASAGQPAVASKRRKATAAADATADTTEKPRRAPRKKADKKADKKAEATGAVAGEAPARKAATRRKAGAEGAGGASAAPRKRAARKAPAAPAGAPPAVDTAPAPAPIPSAPIPSTSLPLAPVAPAPALAAPAPHADPVASGTAAPAPASSDKPSGDATS